MCGIVGFTGKNYTELLQRMTESISYRGPDAFGYFVNEKISLGHRRLSIIDLATGHQPMSDASGEIILVFNGEIYNFKELKDNYLAKYNFRTTSDTEVMINLYLEKGEDFINYLNGMFAFALWDERQEKLILGRDRLGKKPLYYRQLQDNIYFASEPKALVVDGLPKPAMNYSAVGLYFRFQFIPGSISIFEGISRLLPGHYLVWQGGKSSIKPYWQLRYDGSVKPDILQLDNLIEDSVKIRMIADVPLGIFLSGGLDSSTIAYYAAKNSNQKIKTFSIGFEDKSFDESKYCRQVSEFLKTEHYHYQFSQGDLIDLVPKIFTLLDEPLADASILPTYLLSQFTKKYVTVALGGDGADELFAGYPTFQAHQLADIYQKLPNFSHALLSAFIRKLPVSHKNFSFDFKLKQFIKGDNLISYRRDIAWTAPFGPAEQKLLFNHDALAKLDYVAQDIFINSFFGLPAKDNWKNQVLNFWQKGYLVDDIFTKMDRASMYNSLETRSPFMDYRLVELVNNLPYRAKIKSFKTKQLLKEAMKDKLPPEIVYRSKKGFGVPLAKWFAGSLKEFLLASLSPKNIESIGLFNQEYVNKLISDHLNKKQDNRIKLWTLLAFVQWHNNWNK